MSLPLVSFDKKVDDTVDGILWMQQSSMIRSASQRKVIIDCDAGVDDAEALCLCLACDDIQVLAVTCVNGNVELPQVTKNVRRILSACERFDVPVYSGCARPLLKHPEATDFHGTDGLGDADSTGERHETEWPILQSEHACEAIVRLCKENMIDDDDDNMLARAEQIEEFLASQRRALEVLRVESNFPKAQSLKSSIHRLELLAQNYRQCAETYGAKKRPQVEIIALGPLTNIAVAAKLNSMLPCMVKSMVSMVGTREGKGNVPNFPCAEFNCISDPEALTVVLNEFHGVIIFPWETAADNQTSWDVVDNWHEGSGKGKFLRKLQHGIEERARSLGWSYVPCDPLAAAIALYPDMTIDSGAQFRHVKVEMSFSLTHGMTVVDWNVLSGGIPNAFVVSKVNQENAFKVLSRMSDLHFSMS